ncbi:conserved hypothetical protein [Ricinus communis]|uniref:Uncharacterized protein n=1 Tax=Ricinus communis TaxID=3988 RepID=B9RWY1_RICCO|nr:conserved hypothetical protein [Ricinus communis]
MRMMRQIGRTPRFSLVRGHGRTSSWDDLGIEGNSSPISMKGSEPLSKKLKFIQFVKEGAFSLYDGKPEPWVDGEGRSCLGFEIFVEKFQAMRFEKVEKL